MSCTWGIACSVVATCDTTMNTLRYKIFSTRVKVPRLKSLPPKDDSLALHLKRAHIQAMLRKAADRNQSAIVCLCHYGREMSAGTPSPLRASKLVGSPELMNVIACSCSSETPCRRQKLQLLFGWTVVHDVCKCETSTALCQNTFTVRSVN